MVFFFTVILSLLAGLSPVRAVDDLSVFLADTPVDAIFPDADAYGTRRDDAPIIPVLKDDETRAIILTKENQIVRI